MPPLTPPDKPLNPVFWRMVLVLACVLVFSFALHAKLGVYGHGAQPQSSTSSKLWLSGEKLQTKTVAPVVIVVWLSAFLACLFHPQPAARYQSDYETVALAQDQGSSLYRFLRPPPRS